MFFGGGNLWLKDEYVSILQIMSDLVQITPLIDETFVGL